MTTEPDNLERDLAALTRWDGEEPAAWRAAATSHAARPRPWWSEGIAAHPAARVAALVAVTTVVAATAWRFTNDAGMAPAASPAPESSRPAPGRGRGAPALFDGQDVPFSTATRDVTARLVARQATVELETGDVRSAFLKTQMLASAVRGEFVESSALSGEGEQARADVTLRVSVERLSDVLNALRDLGQVRSEQSGGEDVTEQVVDLEARHRNEQRVEQELLELLSARDDAPLADVLDLREHLSRVRVTIEELTARRQNLGSMVALARVLVIIRHVDAEADRSGIGQDIGSAMASAWTRGWRALVNSVAALLEFAVGGMLWWIGAAAAARTALHFHRRSRGFA